MGFSAELELAGRAVLVVGGGADALARISEVLAARAAVAVLAAAPTDAVTDLAERGRLRLYRELPPALLGEVALVVLTEPAPAVEVLADRFAVPLVRPSAGSTGPAGPAQRSGPGRVTLVGGGPGDPGLITVAGLAAVAAADVVVTDRLAPLAVLADARPDALIVDVSKIPDGPTTPQEEINRLLVEHASAGAEVVRLKGGDNFVFGRGGEEWQACAAAGVEVRVIPGVSSATAGPALAGIPVTHRSLNQGFTVVSAHLPPGHPGSTVDWEALSRSGTALILLMGLRTLPAVTAALIGYGTDPDLPAAAVADAGLPSQRKVVGTVATIAASTRGMSSPVITVIGAVAAFDPRG